jgi:L,D-transpeptidase ErfK/SrfK
MPFPFRRLLTIVLLVSWTLLFGVQLMSIGRWAQHLEQNTDRLNALTLSLQQKNSAIYSLRSQNHERNREMEFLQGLFKFLPDSHSFLRTEKALLGEVELLRIKIGRRLNGKLHILVDTKTNRLFLKKGVKLLWEADCSVGKGGVLTDKRTGRKWEFVTPRGRFSVLNKIENPTWIKPDWAFTETGESSPSPNDPRRQVKGELGAYVLSLGDGYLIHGTKNEALLGRAVSHGCIRLGAENLKNLFSQVPIGTEVYIY